MNNPVTLQEFAHHLNEYIDPYAIEESAYNGIQVSCTRPITKIATAVSASIETIEKAIELQATALIVHHGIFRKKDVHSITGLTYKKIKLLMDHDIALLCYHLPLDAHQDIGNNWKAARDLGLENLQSFCWHAKHPIGVIGTIAPMLFDDFTQQAQEYYGRYAQAVKVKNTISTIAIVSGGADGFIADAAYAGADCFITGRVDEPVWDTAQELGISFLAFGHYSTETVGPRALAQYAQQTFDIETVFIKTENPF